jgi:hypothetical protein
LITVRQGLGQQLAQGPFVPLPVDRIEAQDQPDQRPEKGHELHQREADARGGEQHQEHEGRLDLPLQVLGDLQPRHVDHQHAHHGDQGEQDQETAAGEVVGDLFAHDGPQRAHAVLSRK